MTVQSIPTPTAGAPKPSEPPPGPKPAAPAPAAAPAAVQPAAKPAPAAPAAVQPAAKAGAPAATPARPAPDRAAIAAAAERAARNAEAARKLRIERRKRIAKRLGVAVVLPTVLASIYYLGIVTPQYESVSVFTIESVEDTASMGFTGLLGMIPGARASMGDALLAREYILSRDMLAKLVAEHGFLDHYREGHIDWFSRLPADATSEDIYEYFLDQVDAEFDIETGTIHLAVRSFSAEDAHRLASAILDEAEARVNRLSEQGRRDSMSYAEEDVAAAEQRLANARRAVLELQQQGSEFNPEQTAGAVLGVRGALEAELAEARAELSALSATLQPTAARVVAQRQKVAGLARQVAAQNQRLVGGQGEGVSGSIARFEPAVIEKEFAQHAYESALASLELARAEADRKHRYLVRVAEPSQPDDATHPSEVRGILTVFLLSFALLGVGTLMLATLREHANV